MTARDADWEAARAFLVQVQGAAREARGLAVPDPQRGMPPAVVEHLRKVYFSIRPDGNEEGFAELLVAQRERADAAWAKCPSPYEDPTWFAVVDQLFEELLLSAAEMKLTLNRVPLIGTLATGRVNGIAVAIEGVDTRVVLLEQGLFGFANLMCKAVASALPLTVHEDRLSFELGKQGVSERLLRDEEPVARFFDALASYVVHGNPHSAQAYAPPPHVDALASNLRHAMELFILGHEVGHVVSGHLDGSTRKAALPAGQSADTVLTDWQQEFEADFIGMHLMIRTMIRERKLDLALSYCGAHLFFGLVGMVEKSVSLLTTGRAEQWVSESHPPTAQRQANLLQALAKTVGPPESVEAAIKLSEAMDEVMDVFWERSEIVLSSMRSKGLRPAEWWTASH